jgi:hypothetical protein
MWLQSSADADTVDYDCGRSGEHLGVFSGIVVIGDQISELAVVKASDFQEVVRRRAGRCERDLRPKPKFRHQRDLAGNTFRTSDNVGSRHDRHAQIGRGWQQVPEPFPTLKEDEEEVTLDQDSKLGRTGH